MAKKARRIRAPGDPWAHATNDMRTRKRMTYTLSEEAIAKVIRSANKRGEPYSQTVERMIVEGKE